MEASKQEKTDNELIAEFMGWRKAAKGYMVPNTYPIVDGYDTGETEFTDEFLDFNIRWDWLMPVVEKINDLGHNGSVRPESKVYKIIDLPIITPIDKVYKAVVEFIHWHNTQKPLPL